MLEATVKKALYEECRLQEGATLLVAVSGGADSLSLLKVLKKLDLRIIAAHFNHHLRHISDQEALGLQKIAKEWGVTLKLGEEDVSAYAKREKLGVEEAARQCRYNFLFKTAKEAGANAIITAHHADDQIETILMHFLRGAGFSGLEGMRPVSYLRQFSTEIPLWRPLLGVSKDEVLDYCNEQGLEFFTDETNADKSYFRNSLRHILIPEIEKLAPSFRQTILRNAQAIQKDNDLLRAHYHNPGEKLDQEIRIEALSFSRQKFLQSLPAEQTARLKEAILALDPNLRDIGFKKLVQLSEKIGTATRRTEVGHGLILQIDGDEVLIKRKDRSVLGFPQIDTEIILDCDQLPQRITLANDYDILVQTIPWAVFEGLPAATKCDAMHAFLSCDKVGSSLIIQTPFPGLRWRPLGMIEGSQKLSDTFVNAKIPQSARAKYPVIMKNGELVWVPGLRISQVFRLVEKEPQILHLELLQTT